MRPPEVEDAEVLLEFYQQNRQHLSPWEPQRDESFYSLENMQNLIEEKKEALLLRKELSLLIFLQESNALIGQISLSNMIFGVFLSSFLGYKVAEDKQNCGYATEAVKKMVDIAFEDYGLHRVEANVIPGNAASRRVLIKTGFTEEGLSRRYLKLNGKWEDHLHYVRLNAALE